MSKKGKVRTIYSNYNLSNYFDETKEFLIEETAKEPSDVDIWEEIFHQDQNDWENTKEYLFSFFHGRKMGWKISCGYSFYRCYRNFSYSQYRL